MRKNILIIGGSYFVGRVFCILASQQADADLFVVNRGRYTLDKPNIAEFVSDRHDTERILAILPPLRFDAVIDFCAYEPTDISSIVEALGDRIEQYLYLSTSSVYDPADHGVKTERSPLARQYEDDTISQYVAKKALLEQELEQSCVGRGITHTTIRPPFIYGPYNYAPRESYFIKKIVHGEPVPVPLDATAEFSMVYVSDLARALRACVGNKRAFDAVFNASAPERIDYPRIVSELQRCNGAPFPIEKVTVQQVIDEKLPLPFPLLDDELCSGELLAEVTGVSYTPFDQGMDKTFTAFKNVYTVCESQRGSSV
jgi:nucleoside-diphosphate-sugar epimerase